MFKRFLRSINNLPFRLTVTHEEIFGGQTEALKGGELNSPESWDVLRKAHPHFSISEDRAEWISTCEMLVKKDGQDGGLSLRARVIADFIRTIGFQAVFSIGVGGAGLEYQIKKFVPKIRLVCSEYAPENVTLLRSVFTEADQVCFFDMKGSNWSLARPSFGGERVLTLMYRVDPHATDVEWRKIFEQMHECGVSDVLFIPCGFLTLKSLVMRKWRTLRLRMAGQRVVFSGYLRTRKTFESYWAGLYRAEPHEYGGYVGYYLQLV